MSLLIVALLYPDLAELLNLSDSILEFRPGLLGIVTRPRDASRSTIAQPCYKAERLICGAVCGNYPAVILVL